MIRGLLNAWRAPIWAQMVVATASLVVAILRVEGSFRRRNLWDASVLLAAGLALILVAYKGLKATQVNRPEWGLGAVMGYAVFGAVLIGIGLLFLR